ncbi:MAG: formylglycine-generating enzyme family protein [Proteobacteria bacterium]|nr:formylglycine-generating enzyme family protein [Pseudomonadota bacterium]
MIPAADPSSRSPGVTLGAALTVCALTHMTCQPGSGQHTAGKRSGPPGAVTDLPHRPVPAAALGHPTASLVAIPAGTFVMGDSGGDANEAPRSMSVAGFRLMRYEVTNGQFARFVADTGYVTDPEERGFGSVWLDRRWSNIPGADWRHPHGPATSITDRDSHPVVQVSAGDAAAFCAYHELRLPSEVEWEFAARGTDGRRYTWGNEPPYRGTLRGNFGTPKCCAPDPSDGYYRIAPVGQYSEGLSPFGLFDIAGNVWEWTSSPFPGRPGMVALRGGGWGNNSYCLRASYRHANPPNLGLDMVGFRCAADPILH